jgi:hypothetical protein
MSSSHRSTRVARVTALLIAVATVAVGCDSGDADTPTSDPGGSVVSPSGPDPSGTGLVTSSSLPSQMTAAPNPDAGGDGAPTVTSAP